MAIKNTYPYFRLNYCKRKIYSDAYSKEKVYTKK